MLSLYCGDLRALDVFSNEFQICFVKKGKLLPWGIKDSQKTTAYDTPLQ